MRCFRNIRYILIYQTNSKIKENPIWFSIKLGRNTAFYEERADRHNKDCQVQSTSEVHSNHMRKVLPSALLQIFLRVRTLTLINYQQNIIGMLCAPCGKLLPAMCAEMLSDGTAGFFMLTPKLPKKQGFYACSKHLISWLIPC